MVEPSCLDAFKHQDKLRFLLFGSMGTMTRRTCLVMPFSKNRDDGVYTYGFFNATSKATSCQKSCRARRHHSLSIWANELVERSGRVIHGAIREVSLVLSGANPGALIENVTIRHADGDDVYLDDEVIIYTGLDIEHVRTKMTR